MKIIRGFLCLLLLFGFIKSLSQNPKCQKIYVWEFSDDGNKKNSYAKEITDAVEEALINIDECNVLQRRKFGSLQSHVLNESEIQKVRDMNTNIKNNLSTYGAELVLFGELSQSSKSEYELIVRVESLKKANIVAKKSIKINISELVDFDVRKKIITKLTKDLVSNKNINILFSSLGFWTTLGYSVYETKRIQDVENNWKNYLQSNPGDIEGKYSNEDNEFTRRQKIRYVSIAASVGFASWYIIEKLKTKNEAKNRGLTFFENYESSPLDIKFKINQNGCGLVISF